MHLILSPSKRQNVLSTTGVVPTTEPIFEREAMRIAKIMKGYSPRVLQKRLGLSEKLSIEVSSLWSSWGAEDSERISAVELFQGDVYDGLDFSTLSSVHQERARKRVLILSALYGVLYGTDATMPYRLDLNDRVLMGKKSLLVFWKQRVSKYLEGLTDPILDLSSQEYKALIAPETLSKMLTIDFKEENGGKLKTVSFFSKRSRGTFARWVIENQFNDFEKLKEFNEDGYSWNESASNAQTWIFSRKSDS